MWARLVRMLKDDGLIRQVWAKQEKEQKAREAVARKVAGRWDRRTKLQDMELLSAIPLHDFLRIRQAQPGFFRAEEVKGNLKYLKRKADLPIFV